MPKKITKPNKTESTNTITMSFLDFYAHASFALRLYGFSISFVADGPEAGPQITLFKISSLRSPARSILKAGSSNSDPARAFFFPSGGTCFLTCYDVY